MDPRGGARLSRDDGLTSVQFVLAVALSLLLTVGLFDVAVTQYGVGVVRAGLEEGARAGSRVGATAATCASTVRSWLDDALGGARGAGVRVDCTSTATAVRATATATWDAWLPGVPAWSIELSAVRARAPA